MYKITERKAGDFIDLENYFSTMDGNEETIINFFVLLLGRMVESEDECFEVITQYAKEVTEIKESFEFIYNPPQLPSTTEINTPTIGDEYRKEFAEMYGGYVNLIILICKTFPYTPEQCLQMRTQDFLFWGNLLMHRQFVENIK